MFQAGDIEGTLTLDRSPFIRGLQQARADAERFERRRTTATVDADTKPATRRVGGLVGQLERVARKRTSAAVDVDVRGEEQLGFLQRQLTALQDRDIHVRVHVDRARGAIDNLLRKLGSPMVAAAATLATLAPAAIGAAGAIAGIGVAALGILPAFGLLGAGMVMHFKNGGASVQALQKELGHLKGAVENATGPAARAAFAGMAEGLTHVRRIIPTLRDEMTGLGKAVGGMFHDLGEFAASADMVRLWETSIKGATQATKPLTDIIKALGLVFSNVVEAGMPLFIQGLEKMAKWLGKVAESTSDIDKLRGKMEEGAKTAGQFWQIAKNLGGVLKSVWDVARSGPATDLLSAFERGTKELDKFFKTAEGRDILRKTLESMVFFAEELLAAVPSLIKAYGELLDIGRFLWNALKDVVNVLKEIPIVGDSVPAMLLGMAALLGPMGLIRVGLGAVWKTLGMIGASKALSSLVGAVGLGGIAGRMPGAAKGGGRGGGVVPVGGGGRGAPGGVTRVTGVVALDPRTIASLKAGGGSGGGRGRGGGAGGAAAGAAGGAAAGRASGKVAGTGLIAGLASAIAAGRTKVAGAIRRLLGRLGPLFKRIPGVGAVATVIGAAFGKAGPKAMAKVKGIPGKVGGLLKKIPGLGAIGGIIGKAFGKSKGKVDTAVKKVGPSAGKILKGAGKIAARGVFGWPGLIAAVIWSVLPDKLKESIKKAASSAWQSFKSAGSSLMNAIGDGIKAAAGKVLDGLRWVVNQARRLLPGSEPKDSSSPLYGLGRAGAAVVTNLSRGLLRQSPELLDATKALTADSRKEIAGMAAQINEVLRAKAFESRFGSAIAQAKSRLGALDASDRAHAPKPPTRAEQVAAIQGRINQARYATDERGVSIHARPPGVARVQTGEERELLRELWALRQAFEREDLEATANLNINAMIPSDPRVLREIQRSLGRSVRQGRRRRPRRARMA